MQKISNIIENSHRLNVSDKRNCADSKGSSGETTTMQKMRNLSSCETHDQRFERMMNELWEALTAHWGNAFLSSFGDDWQEEKTWQTEIRGLTRNQILAGLEVCKYDPKFADWPPAARVFRTIAIKQPMRAGGATADDVYRNICDFYAQTRPAEAVWIIQKAESWAELRRGDSAAEREFERLWRKMLEFIASGGELPEPVKPVPQIKHEKKRANWASIREKLEVSA